MRAAACVFGLFVWLALVHGEPARVYNISDTNILCQEFNNNQLSNLKLKPQDYAGNEFFEAIANQNFTFLGIETFGRVFKRSTGSNPHHAYGWVAAALQQILCVFRISHNVTFREVNDTDLSLIGGTDSDSTKCWRKVIDGELNFCVGDLWETRERLALTEFTSPIAMERVYTITEETSSSAESRPGTWFKVFNAFDRDVWIYIVVHSILLGFVISVVEFDFPGSWQDWKSNFWHVGQRFCERPRPRGFLWLMGKESREIQTRSGRWLALILSFYVLVVTTTYTGKVASDLTRSTTTYFVDDIEDALTNGKQICALAALNSTLLLQFPDLKAQNLLQTSTEYPEMYSKYYSGTTDCRVFVGADTSLNDYYNYTDCNLTAVSSEFWIPLGWPCQPTHLCNVLSILIADLREGGYIRDQQKVALESNEGKPVGDCSEVSTSDDSEPLSLTSFWGFFELTWIAMAVTFVLTLSFRFLSPLIRRESRATICWPECFRCAVYADENQRLWDGTRPPFVAASWDEALNKLTPTAQANQVPKALDLTEVRGKLTDPNVVRVALEEFSSLVDWNRVDWEAFRGMGDAEVSEFGNVMINGAHAYVLRQALKSFHTLCQSWPSDSGSGALPPTVPPVPQGTGMQRPGPFLHMGPTIPNQGAGASQFPMAGATRIIPTHNFPVAGTPQQQQQARWML